MNTLPQIMILTTSNSFQSKMLREYLFERYLFNTGTYKTDFKEETCFIIQIDNDKDREKLEHINYNKLNRESYLYSDINRHTTKYSSYGGSVTLGKLMPYNRQLLGDKDYIYTNGEFYTWNILNA